MTILEDRPIDADDLSPLAAPPATNGRQTAAAYGRTMAAQNGDEQAAQQLRLVRTARRSNLAITIFIGIASFAMSFVSLSGVAANTAFPNRIWVFHLAWIWPIIVDGLIIWPRWALWRSRRTPTSAPTATITGPSSSPSR